LALRATTFAAVGAAPSTAVGGRIGASARWDWFQVVAELRKQLSASQSLSGGGSARASLIAVSLAPCFARESFALCALGDLGSMRAEGADVADPVVHQLLHVAAGARAELSPRIVNRLHLLLSLEASKSLVPLTLRLREREVWRTPPASFAASLGLELKLQ
jgi:hypothetical protein